MFLLRLVGVVPLLLLSACGTAEDGEPAGLRSGEAQDINDAAVMLDDDAVNANVFGANTSANAPR